MTQKTPKETLETLEKLSEDIAPTPLVAPSNITPEGLRAARGLMDWSREKLREQSGVSVEAIKSIEGGVFKPKPETHEKLTGTLSKNGVEFFELTFAQRHGLNISGVLRVQVTKDAQENSDESA